MALILTCSAAPKTPDFSCRASFIPSPVRESAPYSNGCKLQGRLVSIIQASEKAKNIVPSSLKNDAPPLPNKATSLFAHMASNLCNSLEELANSMKPPILDSHLVGNFLPLMHECPPTPCPHIEGTIPPSLDGVFLRNGSNPSHLPKAGYHYFDGDGMIHAVTISNGHAVHACRFIRTNRYNHEQVARQSLFVNVLGELNGFQGIAKVGILLLRHVFGLLNMLQGFGPANASLVCIDGKVLAMSEDDMPYWINISNDGDIHTIGRFDFFGKLKSSMTAHPKVDPTTGEMFSFSYNVIIPPYLKFFMVTPNGEKLKDVSITFKEPVLVHDFAITENYALFHDNQLVFRLYNMFKGGAPIVCDTNKVPRVGILPRYDTNEANMRWFECPIDSGNCLHFLNAWEEGDEVVMVGSVIKPVELIFALNYKDWEKIETRLTKFRFNLKNGRSTSEQVSYANIDAGRINERYLGKKIRYAYFSIAGPWPKYAGVCKVDLEAPQILQPKEMGGVQQGVHTKEPCMVGWRAFGQGCYGSEPFFVPRSSDSSISEDDGFLLTFVHDEVKDRSHLIIMDAQSPELAILASITMPNRVPYGFHSLFISALHLQHQNLS